MQMKKTAEFTFQGSYLSYEEFEQIWKAVESAGKNCTISVTAATYNDGPMGSSTTTYIEVEYS